MTFGRTTIVGNDIIIPMYMDESDFIKEGLDLKSAFELLGKETAEKIMMETFLEEDLKEELAVLKRYQYNIVMKMIGATSKTEYWIRLSYTKM